MSRFQYVSDFEVTKELLYSFHANPGALDRLLPPWENTSILRRAHSIAPGSRVELKMHFGPIPFTYKALHIKEQPVEMFQDIQEKGPFRSWSHTHLFDETQNGARLTDLVDYQLPLQSFLPRNFTRFVEKELTRTFRHRKEVLNHDLSLHKRYSTTPLTILISGASGVVGRHLVPFLTTGGHSVYTLVRRQADAKKNEIYWDPAKDEIDIKSIPDIDVVIHLAGEYIGLGRWSDERKKRVVDSRVQGTSLLVKTMAQLKQKPKVFLSSSAIGYYGDTKTEPIDETRGPGKDFLSSVCSIWEESARPAENLGIRTVIMRMGVALSCKGGALEKLVKAPIGYVRRFGNGRQMFSWLSMDDLLGAILHCIKTESISGPINLVSPNPVSNEEMISTMAKLTGRPFLPGVPAPVLKMLYGDMAREILLSGCHALPDKLINSGFTFSYLTLEETLRSQLGIYKNQT